MEDFIFGTLATDELRLAHVRRLQNGVTHRQRRSPRGPRPGEPIELKLSVGPGYTSEQAWVYWTTEGEEPGGRSGRADHGWATPMQPVGAEWNTMLWGYNRHFRAVLPGQPKDTILRYCIGAAYLQDEEVFADDGTIYACYIDEDPIPEWAYDAIVYQVFVDRFFPGNGRSWKRPETPAGFYGGTLLGVTEKLDYLVDLGVNVLWLTPVFPSPSHHGYDATNYFDIEPRLGSQADLQALLEAAHRRGLRVLLDFAPNHCSSEHPAFQEAIANQASPYVQWFSFDHWPDRYESFFGVKSLPQFNLRNPAARKHLLEAAAYWLEFGVDGYRLDYAIGPSPDFWADFRRATRKARPDCWTFGEVVEPPDSQIAFSGLLDGCLDFMLLEALRQTFAFGRWDAAHFMSFLDRHEAAFPAGFSRPSFLDNHDMNRILWALQGDKRRLKLAALCQFTLAGPPIIYYGTEVGLSQERDVRQGSRGLPEESRLPMLWGNSQDAQLLKFYRTLAALRRGEPALRRGQRKTMHASKDVLAYVRSDRGASLATVINLGEEKSRLQLPGGWNSIELTSDAGCSFDRENGWVELPPLSGLVLKS
jgi:cyclomaltodextrinase